MPELQWVKWYPQDWLSETGLSLCDIATQGIWANALNWMMRDGGASISGTKEQLARLCRCRPQQIEVAFLELRVNKVAIVEMHNECITFKCRRLLKELKMRALKKKAAAARWCTDDAEHFGDDHAEPHAPSASASASASNPFGKGCGETLYHAEARTVLHMLNEATGSHFREGDANLTVISARLREPEVTLSGVAAMIKRQCERWKNTPQADYLRPETLFGKTKFDSYYANKDLPVIHENNERTGRQGVDRNAGTANSKRIGQYDGVGKVPGV